jgi:hypothetical protein
MGMAGATAASLIQQTQSERERLMILVKPLSDEQADFKPFPDVWSVNEKLEHLVLAESSGVSKIWAAANGVRKGKPMWVGDHTNRGLSIDEVIAQTWKPKEKAPAIATPHIGGPLSYWLEYMSLAHDFLHRLEPLLNGLSLDTVIFPHFISGPLDAGQRIQFLTFHIIRHRTQILELMADPAFPKD